MVPPTNTCDIEPETEPEIEWGPPTAWFPDPRTGRMREYTHTEVLAALLAGDPEEERHQREDAEWLEREEAARMVREEAVRMEREQAQRREREEAEREARQQEQSSGTRRKRGHTHAEMLAALLGDSKREARQPKQEQSKGRDPAQRGDHTTAEPRTREQGQQANAPPGAKKRCGRTHADMLAALLGDPDEEQWEREQAERKEREQAQRREHESGERRAREQAQEDQDHAIDTDDDCGPISFAGGPMLEGMGLPTLDDAMQKLSLRTKRQEEKDAAKKNMEEEEAARAKRKGAAAKQEAEAAKQGMKAAKEDTVKKEGYAKEKASSVNSSRDHQDMGEGRRMPDCRCARCDPCDCEDCHYAHYPTYRRKGPGKW